jgi:hypothetical protein
MRRVLIYAVAVGLGLTMLALATTPSFAQNRKKSWEIFIYFGQYGGQRVPSAIQTAEVTTYRLDPFRAQPADPNNNGALDPKFCAICRNAGATGSDDPNVPADQFLGPPLPGDQNFVPTVIDYCQLGSGSPIPAATDPDNPYLDECDDDLEAVYVYNAGGIKTNGPVQVDDSEFLLGARLGYNITNHWEVELDLGFAKQRLNMTRNLIPMLTEPVSNPADPYFRRLADFYVFTWANIDFVSLGYKPTFIQGDPNTVTGMGGVQEIPNVPQRRWSRNPEADIPAVLPMPLVAAETFEDVTEFINRIYLDPAAIRNRANQVNVDIFSVGLSGVYNFNTKPDSRIVPYVQGGIGRWIRQYDTPYDGENTDYFTFGGGVRFFVNEIFAFRFEARQTYFRDDTSTITANIPRQDLLDLATEVGSACMRDQDPPQQQPPQECTADSIDFVNNGQRPGLPENSGAGGYASIEIITETDNFWEARVGFDIILGGR